MLQTPASIHGPSNQQRGSTMIRNANSALVGALTFSGLAMSLLLVSPAAAVPRLPVTLDDQIRHMCEASSVDLAGKREERRCRADLRQKIEQMGGATERRIRLVQR
jgi:hypothetical protein